MLEHRGSVQRTELLPAAILDQDLKLHELNL